MTDETNLYDYMIAETILYAKTDSDNRALSEEWEKKFMSDRFSASSLGAAVWIGISCVLHIFLLKNNVSNEYQMIQRVLIAFAAIAFTFPMHELIHFIFAWIFCKGKARIEAGKDPMGLPSLRTVYRNEVSSLKKLVILLAPFMLLTVLPDLAFVFCKSVNLFFFVVVICNSAGCYFDLSDAVKIFIK